MFSIKRSTTHLSSPIIRIGLVSVLSWQCHAATIQGTAFEDVNDNGVREACEQVLPDTTIYIQDDAQVAISNGGLFTLITNEQGSYSSISHNTGDFTLWAEIPFGWEQTAPVKGTGSVQYQMTIDNGSDTKTIPFGFRNQAESVRTCSICDTVTEIPKAQCETLVALYDSTDGDNWKDNTGWKQTNTPCSWKGVSCSGGEVNKIILQSNQLTGSIPNLSVLTNLRTLDLYNNQLTGSIPDLSALTNLQHLIVYSNQLTGSIPDLSALTYLKILHLNNNQLTGAIPDLSALAELKNLYLSENQLSGSIPDLSALAELKDLYLSTNQLSGSIPDLSALTDLQEIFLSRNQLTGSIPDLSALTNLRMLYLNNNQLTGAIPDLSASLQEILLNNNQLTGAIPDLSALIRLRYLYLNNNQLTGAIPDLSALTNLQVPDIRGNTELCRNPTTDYGKWTTAFDRFKPCGNPNITLTSPADGATDIPISGQVFDWESTVGSFYRIVISTQADFAGFTEDGGSSSCDATCITTSMNSTLHTASNLAENTTYYWKIRADVDTLNWSEIHSFTTGVAPKIGCDAVTEIPKAQCETLVAFYDSTDGDNWTDNTGWKQTNTPCRWKGITCENGDVTRIALLNNNLTGQISDISALTSLQELTLGRNQLTGAIPELNALTNLQGLELADNQFSGNIPDLNALTKLERLFLNGNQLEGAIPSLPASLQEVNLSGDGNKLCQDSEADYAGRIEVDVFPTCDMPFPEQEEPPISEPMEEVIESFRLGVKKRGTGFGEIESTSPDTAINCDVACTNASSDYLNDTEVTLLATPSDGSILTGWTGACRGTENETTVMMSKKRNCTATFELDPTEAVLHRVRIAKIGDGNGTITVKKDGDVVMTCSNAACEAKYYAPGTELTLTARAKNGATFAWWGEDCDSSESSITVTIDKATQCTAEFALPPPQPDENILTVTQQQDTMSPSEGAITGKGIECSLTNENCVGNYIVGTKVRLTATPTPHSYFKKWANDCSGTKTPATVIMDSDKTCTAIFGSNSDIASILIVKELLDTGELVNPETGESQEMNDVFPPTYNETCYQEAFRLAENAMQVVEDQYAISETWPTHFKKVQSWFEPSPEYFCTKKVRIMSGAENIGGNIVEGKYVQVDVTLHNDEQEEELVSILVYYDFEPTITEAPLKSRRHRRIIRHRRPWRRRR